jgi:hypothetical protein
MDNVQTLDQKSTHAGCPVLKGEKWSATKWMHVAGLLFHAALTLFHALFIPYKSSTKFSFTNV